MEINERERYPRCRNIIEHRKILRRRIKLIAELRKSTMVALRCNRKVYLPFVYPYIRKRVTARSYRESFR